MAAFCTKCGASLSSGTGFCSSCGTPIAASSIPPVATAGAVPAPLYAQPVPAGYPVVGAPPPRSSGVLKIVLIVIAVIVGLGVLGAGALGFMAWRVSKSLTADSNGKGVTLSVPGGPTISAGDSTATDAELGVPMYPGAAREKGGLNMSSASASMIMAHFSTSDSVSEVVDFYKSKMGAGAVAVSTGNGTVLNSGGPDTDRIMVTVGPGSGADAGKTTIVVMHSKKN
jgi:hypothetical protein